MSIMVLNYYFLVGGTCFEVKKSLFGNMPVSVIEEMLRTFRKVLFLASLFNMYLSVNQYFFTFSLVIKK